MVRGRKMSFQISLDIHRSPSEVFAFVADLQNMPRWYDAVEQVTAVAGETARFHMVRSLPGGRATTTGSRRSPAAPG
jgi:hypothetical protein